MKFFDRAKIYIRSGSGGDGSASFRREKYVEFGGPDGGDGGKGGDIYVIGADNLNTLSDYRFKQHFYAENGQKGMGANKTGKSGDDLYLPIPIGTEITDVETGKLICDVVCVGQVFKIAAGGRGGAGNTRFKSSTNRAPRKFGKGYLGKEMTIGLQLKLIANVGLIGMPNAGKSTLLSRISHARPKIADYPFTTLVPNLGVVDIYDKSYVFADIPGLIEHAHMGKGLGIEFLRHVQRCSILVHIIDCKENLHDAYAKIRREILLYDYKVASKPEVIFINKMDTLTSEEIKKKNEEIDSFRANYESILREIVDGIDFAEELSGDFDIEFASTDDLDEKFSLKESVGNSDANFVKDFASEGILSEQYIKDMLQKHLNVVFGSAHDNYDALLKVVYDLLILNTKDENQNDPKGKSIEIYDDINV